MLKKYLVLLLITTLLISLLTAISSATVVFGWSNGGLSEDPANPDYGTHDWIAEHALDWLPLEEKQFILDNNSSYLYGTELPDKKTGADRIGDTHTHHVYYYANGSLQDDAAAKRAKEEYSKAAYFFRDENFTAAARTLGIMTHYISDLAVFGHVMDDSTDWGNEAHHKDYEDHVNTKTNSYIDEFNTYLVHDDTLTYVSAYNAALTLAYNTTFGTNGNYTCSWMDQNYNWSNSAFTNRCGESLNLAVNLIADILHTFFLETHGLAHFIDVPFHYQRTDYYCGPASLEMVFDYYGEDISQFEIADVAQTFRPGGTYTDELRRAAHFSNISTSTGNEILGNITGYTLRKLGYAAFEAFGLSLAQVKNFVDRNLPLILLMRYSETSINGHYRVVTGYNETHVFLHDPWAHYSKYSGPNIALNYSTFLNLWAFSSSWALYVSPWTIDFSAPLFVKSQMPFQVNVTLAYPQQPPNNPNSYSASLCNATITLPNNLTLAQGETPKKAINTDSFEAGNNSIISWLLIANFSGIYTVSVEVEGLISGEVGAHDVYPSYIYNDRIGTKANFTIELNEDSTNPIIGIPSRTPEGDVLPNQEVTVFVNITDSESGIRNATLYYNLNNSEIWAAQPMHCDSSDLYNATILGQPENTFVRFKITVYDYAGNNATRDGTDTYCTYQVIPESFSIPILIIFMILAVLPLLYVKSHRRKTDSTFING